MSLDLRGRGSYILPLDGFFWAVEASRSRVEQTVHHGERFQGVFYRISSRECQIRRDGQRRANLTFNNVYHRHACDFELAFLQKRACSYDHGSTETVSDELTSPSETIIGSERGIATHEERRGSGDIGKDIREKVDAVCGQSFD